MPTRRTLIIATACVTLIGIGLVIAQSRDDQPLARRVRAATPPPTTVAAPQNQRYAQTRANGLSLAHLRTVFVTQEGRIAGVVRGHGVTCLVYSTGEDRCATQAQIAQGQVLNVRNDCSKLGHRSMTIVGLVPGAVRSVSVAYSNRTALIARVTDSAFNVEATTPMPGKPHPVVVLWRGAKGKPLARLPFPVLPGEYCHPTERAGLEPSR